MDADLDTLATALYVRTDDLLKDHPHRLPWRPAVGIAPRICDAEMVTLSVMQALLGHTSEARWLRFAGEHLRHLFPYLPKQPGYNKRLRRLAVTLNWLIGALARDTSVWSDDVWVSTRRRWSAPDPVRRSDAPTWLGGPNTGTAQAIPASFGDCACTWSRPCMACPSGLRSPAPRPTNARSCSTYSTMTPPWPHPDQGRSCWRTRTTTAASSRPASPAPASNCCAAPERANPNDPAAGSSNHYAKRSSRSLTPSKASSISNSTADTPHAASWSASCNACWP